MRGRRRFYIALGILTSSWSLPGVVPARDSPSISPERLVIRQELLRDFDHMQMALAGKLVECKGAVSLWQVAVVLGKTPAPGSMGGKEAIIACIQGGQREAQAQSDRLRARLPAQRGMFQDLDYYMGRLLSQPDPTAELMAALQRYLTTVKALFSDFLPHADATQRESPSAYDQRFEAMESTLESSATAVREAIRNWR